MPQQHMVIPHYMGSGREQEDGNTGLMNATQPINRQDSFSSLAAFQDIPLLIPQEADGVDSASGNLRQSGLGKSNNNFHGQPQPSRPPRAPFSFRKSKIAPLFMDMPMRGFVDEQGRSSVTVVHPPMKSHDREWWESQERGNLVVSADESGQVGPRVTCRCQVTFFSFFDSMGLMG